MTIYTTILWVIYAASVNGAPPWPIADGMTFDDRQTCERYVKVRYGDIGHYCWPIPTDRVIGRSR